jgi:hypothetical protein
VGVANASLSGTDSSAKATMSDDLARSPINSISWFSVSSCGGEAAADDH